MNVTLPLSGRRHVPRLLRKTMVKGTSIQASFRVQECAGARFGLITLEDDLGSDGTNAIAPAGLQSLAAAIDAAEQSEIAAVAVTGNPRWFSSGADLGMFRAAADRSQVLSMAQGGHEVFRRLTD